MEEIQALKARFSAALHKMEATIEAKPPTDAVTLQAHINTLKEQLDAESTSNHAMRVRLEDFDAQVEQFETEKAAQLEKFGTMRDLQAEFDALKALREKDLKEIDALVSQLEPLLKRA